MVSSDWYTVFEVIPQNPFMCCLPRNRVLRKHDVDERGLKEVREGSQEHRSKLTIVITGLDIMCATEISSLDRVLAHDAPRKLPKGDVLVRVDLLAEVGLREDGQRVPRHPAVAHGRPHAAHEVRDGLEPPFCDPLQRLARLERDAVPRDLDLDRLPGPRLDVQPGQRVGAPRQLVQRRQSRVGGVAVRGDRRGRRLLVDEHGRRQRRQHRVVQVDAAPVVLVPGRVLLRLRVVVQQPRLGGVARAHDVLDVAAGVAFDLALGVAVAGARDEDGGVDEEAAEVLEAALEAREDGRRRPDVGREVLGEVLGGELGRGPGAVERRVRVEGAVGVERALEGVDLAVLQLLLAQGPAGEILCGRVLNLA